MKGKMPNILIDEYSMWSMTTPSNVSKTRLLDQMVATLLILYNDADGLQKNFKIKFNSKRHGRFYSSDVFGAVSLDH